MSDIGPQEVVDAVEAIHAEPDDDASLALELALLEETNKPDEDEGTEDEDEN